MHAAASSAAPAAVGASGRVPPVSAAKRGQMGGGAEDPSGPCERQRAKAAPEGLGEGGEMLGGAPDDPLRIGVVPSDRRDRGRYHGHPAVVGRMRVDLADQNGGLSE